MPLTAAAASSSFRGCWLRWTACFRFHAPGLGACVSAAADNPGCSIGEQGKLLGAMWTALSDEEKAPYKVPTCVQRSSLLVHAPTDAENCHMSQVRLICLASDAAPTHDVCAPAQALAEADRQRYEQERKEAGIFDGPKPPRQPKAGNKQHVKSAFEVGGSGLVLHRCLAS